MLWRGVGLLVCVALADPVSPASSIVSVLPEPLTTKAFGPFGQIVAVPEKSPPTVENAIWKYWGGLAKTRIHKGIEFGMFKAKARLHEIAEMERHRWSPELLVSIDSDFYLAVAPYVRPKAGRARPDAAKVKVFIVKRGQAVLLHKGAWHTLPFPIAGEGLFLVAFRDGTRKKDLTLRAFKGRETVKF